MKLEVKLDIINFEVVNIFLIFQKNNFLDDFFAFHPKKHAFYR